ncbi:hypothetical protein CsSME_00006763 [Camellia sinensis var. sinensis]
MEMGSQWVVDEWSRYEVMAKQGDEDTFTFPTQVLPPLDFSGYSALDCQYDHLSMQESVVDALPLMGIYPTHPSCSTLDLVPSPSAIQEDFLFGYGNGYGVLNQEKSPFGFEIEPHSQNQPLLLCDNNAETQEEYVKEKRVNNKRCREEKSNSSKTLSRKTISEYFYMPITQAAKEMNIGLTLLKKKCRELGIRRWPHRKLMSLQTLIKNVQEMDKGETKGAEGRLKEAIDVLEQERKLMEEVPDMQLEDKTKRLRQACFKASYKKRKLMGAVDPHSSSSSSSSIRASNTNATTVDFYGTWEDEEEEEEISLSLVVSTIVVEETLWKVGF